MRRLVSILFLCASCVDPYNPPALNQDFDALVVDGFIDSDGTASVKLSRGVPLNSGSDQPIESGATVTIESSGGEIFSLTENSPGNYNASGLHVDKKSTYAVHLVTDDDVEYRSDNVKIYSTPAIDSVYWTINGSNQVQIMLDSHDDNPDASGFYLANAIETYEYHAAVISRFKFINHVAYERLPDEYVYACWRDELTHNALATTKGLKRNVISGAILSIIDNNSPKISVRYSALAKLRSISQEEFAFQKQLIASNEQTGSLFSQIPGTVLSNVHCLTRPGEYVLGYFRAQEVKTLRYFIDLYTHPLPSGFYEPVAMSCQPETTCRFDQPNGGPNTCVDPSSLSDNAIITSLIVENRVTVAYIFVSPECGDCRYRGGTTVKPPFW